MHLIAPSILSADFSQLSKDVEMINNSVRSVRWDWDFGDGLGNSGTKLMRCQSAAIEHRRGRPIA